MSKRHINNSGFTYFHVGRKPDLTSLRPSKFDVNGRMPARAVFVTTSDHVSYWAGYIRDNDPGRELYLYGVTVPASACIEEGIDGAERGDFKVVTDDLLPVTYVCQI